MKNSAISALRKISLHNVFPFLTIVRITAVLIWMIYLCQHTDSLCSIYVLCAVCSLFFLLLRLFKRLPENRKSRFLFPAASVVFGLAVCAANYQDISSVLWFLLLWFGGFFTVDACLNGIFCFSEYIVKKRMFQTSLPSGRSARRLFLACFALISLIDLAYLFLFRYPGCMNSDGIIQVTNGLYDIRANHFPYVHTLLLLSFLKAGLWISGGLNLGIAFYCCFQIFFLAFCFSFAIYTLYQKGISKPFLVIVGICYVFMPYHIAYSCMVWKDVLYGGAVLLFITALYRIFCCMGRPWVNYALLTAGGYGFALFRNNGWYALFLTFFLLLLLFYKKMKRTLLLLFLVLASTWFLTHPIYDMLGVTPSEFTESLSIPVQQIARVVADGGNITEQQAEAIDELIDYDSIPEKYDPDWADPIKFSVDHERLSEQKGRYFKLWVNIGLNNPVSYIKAWIDQTKGYWNGGYSFWIWYTTIDENWFDGYGSISQTIVFERGARLVDYFMKLFMELPVFDVFRSIGFSVWLVGLCFLFFLKRKDYRGIVLTLPVIGTVLTLWIATPVFCEFRYAYAVFTCIPFLLVVALHAQKCKNKEK